MTFPFPSTRPRPGLLYETYFQGPLNAPPAGWSSVLNSNMTLTVIADALGVEGRSLRITKAGPVDAINIMGATWNEVPDQRDVEILMRWRINDLAGGSGDGWAEPLTRFSGTTTANFNAWFLRNFEDDGNDLRVQPVRAAAGAIAGAGDFGGGDNMLATEWFWSRFRVTGGAPTVTIRSRSWRYTVAEPAAIVDSSSSVTTPGKVGLFSYRGASTAFVDYFAVSTTDPVTGAAPAAIPLPF